MKIAVIGPGGIGSTFAFQLARAGHDVTVVARGKRLEQLQRDQAVITSDGQRAGVRVTAVLDETTQWELVLVTVLASQVDALLPALRASAARQVMFMFNTFEPLGRLRDAVGPARFTFGFPAILASVDDGKLTTEIVARGPLVTTVADADWARAFTAAGIASVVCPDMQSWLRTHAAFVVPVMVLAHRAHQRKAGISWGEARTFAAAMREGFTLVRRLGNTITPSAMTVVERLPSAALTALLWTTSRVPAIRKSGAAGPGESRSLIDAMRTAAHGELPALLAIRPD